MPNKTWLRAGLFWTAYPMLSFLDNWCSRQTDIPLLFKWIIHKKSSIFRKEHIFQRVLWASVWNVFEWSHRVNMDISLLSILSCNLSVIFVDILGPTLCWLLKSSLLVSDIHNCLAVIFSNIQDLMSNISRQRSTITHTVRLTIFIKKGN